MAVLPYTGGDDPPTDPEVESVPFVTLFLELNPNILLI